MSLAAMTPLVLATLIAVPPESARERADLDLSADMAMPDQLPASEWLTSFSDGQRYAVENDLPLLLHFEAAWCGACRTMESSVLNKPEVLEQLGTVVVGVRIDADQHRELISEYEIASLPTEVLIAPDGTELARYVGGESLSGYLARLSGLSRRTTDRETASSGTESESGNDEASESSLRACLIVRRDGRMVGLGGFSPVALSTTREWHRGSEDFVVTFEGVDYFLQSADEVARFTESPREFIPRLHGCDLVALSRDGRAEPGAIEFGSFYKGEVFFFASLSNRNRFQSNPEWYVNALTYRRVNNSDDYPFFDPDVARLRAADAVTN